MRVLTIRLRNFRNHGATDVAFGSGLNVVTGDNGQGKTNLLEAVAYLGLTKSFYASSDATVLRHGAGGFSVEGLLISDGGLQSEVEVRYAADGGGKSVLINGSRPETFASVIGRFPVVVLSPENSAVTFGGPGERRRFVDILLSQLSRPYFQDLLDYRRALRQRNRLLLERRESDLDSWDEALAGPGSRIILRRRAFTGEFASYIERAYTSFAGAGESPVMEYLPSPAVHDEPDAAAIRGAIEGALRRSRAQDLHRGNTGTGPHRDEFRLLINGTSVQLFASQGQHKTLLVALTVAEFRFLQDRLGEHPIVLLDDVFSELDAGRSRRILELVGGMGQVVVTATDLRSFGSFIRRGTEDRLFEVHHGTVREA